MESIDININYFGGRNQCQQWFSISIAGIQQLSNLETKKNKMKFWTKIDFFDEILKFKETQYL
jgi:hypothetical protein